MVKWIPQNGASSRVPRESSGRPCTRPSGDRTLKVRTGSNGVHLFDRRTGLNVLLDEIKPGPESWSRGPRHVSIAVTNACDLSCEYCYAAKAPAQIDADAVVRWARELDDAGCFGIGFGGGEPTLYPRFPELCRRIHNETSLAVTFTTHGHRLSPQIVSELSGVTSFIRLSMDGLDATYERLRGRSFDRFKQQMEYVKAIAPFGINYVVNGETITDLPRAADFTFSSGAQELLLLPETGVNGELVAGDAVIQEMSAWARANYGRVRLATSAFAAGVIECPILTPESEDATFDFMHVDALGVLKRSAFELDGLLLGSGASILAGIETIRRRHQSGALLHERRQG